MKKNTEVNVAHYIKNSFDKNAVVNSDLAINNIDLDEKVFHSNELTEESQKKNKAAPNEDSEKKPDEPKKKIKERFLDAYNLIFGEDSEDQV